MHDDGGDDALLRDAHDYAQRFLHGLEQRPVCPQQDAATLRARLPARLPEAGLPAREVLAELIGCAERGLVASSGPRYFGFVVGGVLPAALAADWLTSLWDQNACLDVLSPAAAAFEQRVAEWLLDVLRLPSTSSVGLVTGGQMANFTGLAAGRNELLRRAGWDLERDGLCGAPPLTVLVGADAHATVFAALRMLGIGRRQVREVAADDQGRMRLDALAAALAKCDSAPLVAAQAGNVNSGSFDAIAEVAALAHARGAWLHVDGAFGLWARASATRRELAAGAELADSIACDAHKWLNVPYDCGFAIIADPAAHRSAVANAHAAYLVRGDAGKRDGQDFVPEASRRARAFAAYAALRSLGRDGLARLVDGCCELALLMAERLSALPGTRLLNHVVLNQVLVRFEGPSLEEAACDALTRGVLERVQRSGSCWAGPGRHQGRAAIRISISNWRTRAADIEQTAAVFAAALRAELQSASDQRNAR